MLTKAFECIFPKVWIIVGFQRKNKDFVYVMQIKNPNLQNQIHLSPEVYDSKQIISLFFFVSSMGKFKVMV